MKYQITYISSVGFMVETCVRYTNDYHRFLESVKELHDSITGICVDRQTIFYIGIGKKDSTL